MCERSWELWEDLVLESTGCWKKRLGDWFGVMLKVSLSRHEELRSGLRMK